MDCFRSGLDWRFDPPEPVVLAGLEGGDGCEPKKSKPSSELLVLIDFGGAGSALGGGWVGVGAAVLARGTGSSPPMRSTSGAGVAVAVAAGPPFRSDSFLSMLCFSLTMLRGTSSSPSASNSAGSGIGPSITHLLRSYLVRMKFSILASEGTWPGASFDSQYLFARALPHFRTLCSCSSVQESRSTDLTRLMWTPMLRWMPEQRMQMKTPRFQLAHRGSVGRICQRKKQKRQESTRAMASDVRLFLLQSAHILLGSNLTSDLSVAEFFAARSAAGFGGRLDIVLAFLGVRKGTDQV